VNGEKWCAFCPVKAACAFCVAAALLARSDTRVYLARRRLAASAPIYTPYQLLAEQGKEIEKNSFDVWLGLIGYEINFYALFYKVFVPYVWQFR